MQQMTALSGADPAPSRDVSAAKMHVDLLAAKLNWASPPHEGWICQGQRLGEEIGIAFRYAPVWELQTGKSRLLVLTMNGQADSPCDLSRILDSTRIVDVEIALLFMTVALAQRFSAEGKIVSLMLGVSHETMARRETRLRYLNALKDVDVPLSCPVLLGIEHIPDGAVVARIAQLSAMLAAPNVRVVLNFQNARALPPFDFKLGVAGIGTTLPPGCDVPLAARLAQEIQRRALDQKCLTFLHGLDSSRLVSMAEELGIKFGTGQALDKGPEFTGQGELPQFPLHCRTPFLKPLEESGGRSRPE